MEPVQIFKTLADETRFKLVKLLLTHDLCVGALAKHLGISEAAVSQHMKSLREAGLVKGEKRGYWTHYTVEKDKLHELAGRLKRLDRSAALSRRCLYQETEQQNRLSQGGRKNVRLQVSATGEIERQTRSVHPRTDQGMPRGQGTSLCRGRGKEKSIREIDSWVTLRRFKNCFCPSFDWD